MKLKNIIAISATSVALSGAVLVSAQIQNQNLMQATTVEAAKLTQGQVNTQKADAQVMKAVKAKANHKSKRTVNKYVKNATRAVNRIKNKKSEPVSVSQTKSALVKILNTVNHPDASHLNASKTAINKISSKSTRNSMNNRYLPQLNKFVKVSKTNAISNNVNNAKKANTQTKTYNNNPLDRPVTDKKDLELIEASNITYSNHKKADEITNKLSNYVGPYIYDLTNGKYSWDDIPGNNNIEKIYKLANHMGLKLSYVNYYPSEKQLDQLAKKQFTTKKQKIWSKVYKKYAPYTWAEEIVNNKAKSAKECWISESYLAGLDNQKKAWTEYRKLTLNKYQREQVAKGKAFRQERDKEWKAQHEAQ